MDSGKVLFRDTNGWRGFVEDRIYARGFSGFSDYVGVSLCGGVRGHPERVREVVEQCLLCVW